MHGALGCREGQPGILNSWVHASECWQGVHQREQGPCQREQGLVSEGQEGAVLDAQGWTVGDCACWGSMRVHIEGAMGVMSLICPIFMPAERFVCQGQVSWFPSHRWHEA